MVVLGGADVSLSDFSIKDNSRVGLFLASADGTEFTSVSGMPTFEGKEGEIAENQYGVTMWGIELNSQGIQMESLACFDNASTVDGCMCAVDFQIPNPSKEIDNLLGKEED